MNKDVLEELFWDVRDKYIQSADSENWNKLMKEIEKYEYDEMQKLEDLIGRADIDTEIHWFKAGFSLAQSLMTAAATLRQANGR